MHGERKQPTKPEVHAVDVFPSRSRVFGVWCACGFLQVEIPIGTMMELPRACQTADEVVGTHGVEFMSFGTNVSSSSNNRLVGVVGVGWCRC